MAEFGLILLVCLGASVVFYFMPRRHRGFQYRWSRRVEPQKRRPTGAQPSEDELSEEAARERAALDRLSNLGKDK